MILMRRIKIQGFICVDHLSSVGESFAELGAAFKAGTLKFKEDIRSVSINDYVETVNQLYSGGNFGKLIMKIAE
jgi:NADPH-dependent curcumin reductase CurA